MGGRTSERQPARPWLDLAACQDGVLGRGQALRAGLTSRQWQWRLDSERWQRVLPGVAVTHSGAVSARQRSWAAVVLAGAGATLSGDAALVEHGMRLPEPRVLHVAVPAHRDVVEQSFAGPDQGRTTVVTHRLRRLDDLRHPARRPPVVRVAPALLHAAAWASSDRAAEWRVAAAVQQWLVPVRDLRAALDAMPRLHRRRLVLTVLDDVELGAHAAGELAFLRFLRTHGLPMPDRLQRPVRAGRLRYLDAWWERQRVGVEMDGAHHRSAGAWDEDLLRADDVVVGGRAHGVVLLRFTSANLRHDAARVAAQLSAALG